MTSTTSTIAEEPAATAPATPAAGSIFLPSALDRKHRAIGFGLAVVTVAVVLAFLLARGAFDFDCYWLGSWAVRDGNPTAMYAALDAPNAHGRYDLANETPAWRALADAHLRKSHALWGFIYPPPCAVLFLPLTYLPRPAAVLLWRCLNLAAYLVGIAMLLALARERLRPTQAGILALLALVSPPFLLSLGIGQITPLVFLTVAAGLYFVRTGRPAQAGIALALGTLLKVSPALFVLWLLARRQYTAVAVWAAGLIGLCLLSLPLTGSEPFRQFLGQCLPLLSHGTSSDTNLSILALAGRALGLGSPQSAEILPPDHRLTLLKLGFYALVLGISLFAIWRARAEIDGERMSLEYAILNMVALLLSPITWGHHLVLANLTLLILAARAMARGERMMLAVTGLAYLLLLQNRDLPGSFLPAEAGALSALTGLLVLWLASCLAARPRLVAGPVMSTGK